MVNTEYIIKEAEVRMRELSQRAEAYLSRALSSLDIRAVLFNEIMNWRKYGPMDSKSDQFFDGSPHHASATYSILEQMGLIEGADLLENFGKDRYPSVQPGYGIAGFYNAGSLGTSLTKAAASASLRASQGIPGKVYVFEGNASMQEGSSQEALGFIRDAQLTNLVLIINDNGHGLDGVMRSDLAKILEGYGFEVIADRVDGHDLEAVRATLARTQKATGPAAVIYKTALMKDLGYVLPQKSDKYVGSVIADIASRFDFVVFTADTAQSTGLCAMKAVASDRLVDFGCREQLMVDAIEMYVRAGKSVVAGTFARYLLERAREQVSNLIDYYAEGNAQASTVLLATHNGISHAHNGKSHFYLQGYEFIDRPFANLHHAADPLQLQVLIERALQKKELTIILTEREDGSPTLFERYPFTEEEPVPITNFIQQQCILLIANGHLIHAAKKVAEELPCVELLSLPHLNSLAENRFISYLKGAERVIILEESSYPYLGEKVQGVALKNGLSCGVVFQYITDTGFDTYEGLLKRNNLDYDGIKLLVDAHK